MDSRAFILATSFVVLSVFMSIPQPGSGAQGTHHNTHNNGFQRSSLPLESDDAPTGDARPRPTCSDEQEHCSSESSQNLAIHNINKLSDQIQMELEASQTYLAMAAYFGRDDVAYRGFAKFFMKSSDEERAHAVKLVDYLNLRGGYPKIKGIDAPARSEWSSPIKAIEDALYTERLVNDALLDIHWDAQNKNDNHLQDFLESEYLNEQVDSIRELAGFLTVLRRLVDNPLGIHQFDEELFNGSR